MTIESEFKADIETLRKSVFKIGVQKDGVLTDMSLSHLEWAFGSRCPKYKKDNKILSIGVQTQYGIASIHFMRNLDLGPIVANGLLDAAIVGTDMVEENDLDNRISQIRVLSDGSWGLSYMTAIDRPVDIKDAKIVGTPYPRITQNILRDENNQTAQIWRVTGSSELLPLLNLAGVNVDGILDISDSGKSASANGLFCLSGPYRLFKPVLIANYSSLRDESKANFFKIL